MSQKTKSNAAREAGQSKATPGPWTTERIKPENQQGVDIFIVPVGNEKDWIARISGGDGEQENAALIASSPELLDALRDLLAWANLDHSTNPATVALRYKCEFAIKNATLRNI